eukprot:m.161082 g.161082  ORF g.161082 m.161082 type:complete len:86 (+) comp24840_c0_seq3:79-336(+)
MSLAKLLKEPRVLFTGGDETDIIYNFNTPINNFALFECLLDTEKRATLKAMLKVCTLCFGFLGYLSSYSLTENLFQRDPECSRVT